MMRLAPKSTPRSLMTLCPLLSRRGHQHQHQHQHQRQLRAHWRAGGGGIVRDRSGELEGGGNTDDLHGGNLLEPARWISRCAKRAMMVDIHTCSWMLS